MRRITLITVLSVIGVLAAGTVAVGANLGILDAADRSDVGTLTATEDLAPLEPEVVHVTDPAPATTPDPALIAAVEDGVVTITEVVDAPAAPAATGTPAAAAPAGDDDEYDDDEYEDEYESDDEYEDEDEHEDEYEHEYEGSEDDD